MIDITRMGNSDQSMMRNGYDIRKIKMRTIETKSNAERNITPTTLIIEFCIRTSKKLEIFLIPVYVPESLFQGKKNSFKRDLMVK